MSLKTRTPQKVTQTPAKLPVRTAPYQPNKNTHESYHAQPQQTSSRQHNYDSSRDESMSMKGMQKALPRDKKQSNKPVPISHGVSYQEVKNGHYQKTEKPVSQLKGGNRQESEFGAQQTAHYGGATSSHMSSSSYDW